MQYILDCRLQGSERGVKEKGSPPQAPGARKPGYLGLHVDGNLIAVFWYYDFRLCFVTSLFHGCRTVTMPILYECERPLHMAQVRRGTDAARNV